MKDFEFAKRLYDLRTKQGLTQKELSIELGVTNKAISKWENAQAMPSIDLLPKLSSLFNISIDELISTPNKSPKQIYKITITGGPCSGKSTALSWIQAEFTKKGYIVMFIPETASELILGGISPWTINTNYNFQSYIITQQLEKERLYERAAENVLNYDKVLIICDRGVLDCKAYMSDLEFESCLKSLGKSEVVLRDSYDAVFHLETAAKGARKFYTLENNKARLETPEEAIIKDDKVLNAWMGHPHLRVIDNSTNFEGKMRRLLSEIASFIGEPQPYEIERKFLIKYPNIEQLEAMPNCRCVEIIQTYLKSEDGDEIRIRQRGQNGYFTYTKTIKRTSKGIKRFELERRISKDEYLNLLLEADTTKHQIRKNRYCLMHKNQYFEIDVYPFWKDKAIMEIELTHEKQKIEFPKTISVIKEVTGDKEYSNAYLAANK